MPVPVLFSPEMPRMRHYPHAVGPGKRRFPGSLLQQSGGILLFAFSVLDYYKIPGQLPVCEKDSLEKVGDGRNDFFPGDFDCVWGGKEYFLRKND